MRYNVLLVGVAIALIFEIGCDETAIGLSPVTSAIFLIAKSL
jgi:hypothetical protein